MPGFGFKMAAMLISSIKNIDKFDLASKLACYAGLAPVEHSSGTSKRLNLKKCGFLPWKFLTWHRTYCFDCLNIRLFDLDKIIYNNSNYHYFF